MEDNKFPSESKPNNFLTGSSFTIGHLKIYVRMKYATDKEAGYKAGLSGGRVRQILNGEYLPSSPELIYRIARGWSLDPVKLTLLFDKYRKEVSRDGD